MTVLVILVMNTVYADITASSEAATGSYSLF